ncbi:hypothetical protein ACIPC1_21170 [Streptomyces sp. NPDC087263]
MIFVSGWASWDADGVSRSGEGGLVAQVERSFLNPTARETTDPSRGTR